jgi:oligopeptidase A
MRTTEAFDETLYRAIRDAGERIWQTPTGITARWSNGSFSLRRESAALLGYESYAEVSLVPKMARTRRSAHLPSRLGSKAKPFAERDMLELRAFARDRLGLSSSWHGTSPTPLKSCARSATASRTRRSRPIS